MDIECALFATLGRDAEGKTSKNGKPYLRLNVACSEGETLSVLSWHCRLSQIGRAKAKSEKPKPAPSLLVALTTSQTRFRFEVGRHEQDCRIQTAPAAAPQELQHPRTRRAA